MRYLLFLLGALLLLVVLHLYFARGSIVSAHVINMASSRDRYTQFMKHAAGGGLTVVRWDAINGKALSEAEAAAAGVSSIPPSPLSVISK